MSQIRPTWPVLRWVRLLHDPFVNLCSFFHCFCCACYTFYHSSYHELVLTRWSLLKALNKNWFKLRKYKNTLKMAKIVFSPLKYFSLLLEQKSSKMSRHFGDRIVTCDIFDYENIQYTWDEKKSQTSEFHLIRWNCYQTYHRSENTSIWLMNNEWDLRGIGNKGKLKDSFNGIASVCLHWRDGLTTENCYWIMKTESWIGILFRCCN